MDTMSGMARAAQEAQPSMVAPSGCGSVGLAGPEYDYCEFIGTWRYSESTKQIQELLKAKGATKLTADGLWGPCTDSAFQKVFGESLTQESLQRLLGVTCKTFKKQVSGACTNGSDTVGVVTPTKTDVVASKFLMTALRAIQPDKGKLSQFRIVALTPTVAPTPTPQGGGGGGTSTLAKSTVVTGVPDWALGVGLVAAVAGIAYLIKRK